jgi:hypothetical protein
MEAETQKQCESRAGKLECRRVQKWAVCVFKKKKKGGNSTSQVVEKNKSGAGQCAYLGAGAAPLWLSLAGDCDLGAASSAFGVRSPARPRHRRVPRWSPPPAAPGPVGHEQPQQHVAVPAPR